MDIGRPRDALFGGSLESVLSLQTIQDELFYYGSDDGLIRCFSLKYGKRFQLITGHTGWINQLVVVKPTESQREVLDEKHAKDMEIAESECEQEDQEWQRQQMEMEQEKERVWYMFDEKRQTQPVLRKMRAFLNRVMVGIRAEQHWREQEVSRHMRYELPRVSEGYSMYSCSRDGDIRYWDLSTGSCVQVFQGHECPVYCIDLLVRDEQQVILASGAADGNVALWDPSSAEVKRVISGHAASVTSVKFQDNTLFSASLDTFARVVDVETFGLVGTYQPSRSGIKCMRIHESEVSLGACDSLVYTYDIRSRDLVRMFRGIHRECINCISQLDNYLFTGSDDKDIVQWDIRMSRPVYVYRGHLGPVKCFSLAESGTFLYSGSFDMSIRKWDIAYRQIEIEQEEEMRKRINEERMAAAAAQKMAAKVKSTKKKKKTTKKTTKKRK